MKNNWVRWSWRIASLVFFLGFLIFVGVSTTEKSSFDNETTSSLNDGWVYHASDGKTENIASLPASLPVEVGEPLVISRQIPQALHGTVVLCFRSSQQSVQVLFDGKVIYEYGQDPTDRAFGKTAGSLWNLVRLPSDCGGKTVTLVLTSQYQMFSGQMSEVRVGTKAALLYDLLQKHAPALVLSCLIASTGFGLVIAYGVLLLKKEKCIPLLHLGNFALLVALWIFGESKAIQFFFGNQLLLFSITMISLMLFPIALIRYLASVKEFHIEKIAPGLIAILSIQAFFVCLLQLFNIADFWEMLPVIFTVLIGVGVITLGTVLASQFRQKKRLFSAQNMTLLLFVLLAGAEAIGLFKSQGERTGYWILAGVLIFILVQATILFTKTAQMMRLSRVAGVDLLTNCHSRTSYIQRLEDCKDKTNLSVVMADLNNLKQINDTYGHGVGDDALIRCARCLAKAFEGYENCYRIGGDEFVFLGWDISSEELEKRVQQFHKSCSAQAKGLSYPFSAATGYACFDQDLDATPEDTLQRADRAMYACKHAQKESFATAEKRQAK